MDRNIALEALNLATSPANTPAWDAAILALISERGTRDALVRRVANMEAAERNAFLHALDSFKERNMLIVVSLDFYTNLLCVMATLAYIEGDTDMAITYLNEGMGLHTGHKMSVRLWDVIQANVPHEMMLRGLAALDEEECLAFAG